MPELVDMHLVAHKGKVLTKRQNEILDIRHYRVLYDTLINVLWVSLTKFFHIDKVEQVIILEHRYSLGCITSGRHGCGKVVWHL